MRISFRTQLSIWVGLAIIIIVFSTIFVTQQILAWNMQKGLDNTLKKNAFMVAAVISSDITTDEESYKLIISDLANQKLSFVPSQLRVVNPQGKTIVSFGDMSDTLIQQLDTQLYLPEDSTGKFGILLTEGNSPLRSFTIAAPDPVTDSTLAYVQIIESLEEVEQTKQDLWRNGLIIGLVGSIVAVAIMQFIIRRGFRPLYAIVDEINKADYDHLEPNMQKNINSVELQQLAKSLSALWLRLDMAVSDKRKATGSLSHDIRTPLAAIQGQLEVLLSQPSLDPGTRESVEKMLSETQRLIRMVKNMLLNVQLESRPPLEMVYFNLKEALNETIGNVWILAREIELNVDSENIRFYGNRDLIKQLLVNIIDNAIKFTGKGGEITIMLKQDGDFANLEVNDSGRGISREHLPHVTEAFYKIGKSQRTEGEGSHLGLAIVKQIVELHHGTIEIKSQEGAGTSVTVRLPLRGPEITAE